MYYIYYQNCTYKDDKTKHKQNKTTQNGPGNENEIQNSFYSDSDMVSEFNRAR